MRKSAASQLRRLANALWKVWRMDEVRHLTDYDIAVIRVVGAIDSAANRLDPPY